MGPSYPIRWDGAAITQMVVELTADPEWVLELLLEIEMEHIGLLASKVKRAKKRGK